MPLVVRADQDDSGSPRIALVALKDPLASAGEGSIPSPDTASPDRHPYPPGLGRTSASDFVSAYTGWASGFPPSSGTFGN
jgi:hypothetical protein